MRTNLEEEGSVPQATANNTETASPFAASSSAAQPRARKVVGFVRSEPGYRISLVIDIFLLLNGIISGILALVAATKDVNDHIQGPDQYESYDIGGVSFFCLWNSILLSLILIFPSITTTKRERNLIFFYLNGFSILLLKLSDFFIKISRFELIQSLISKLFLYLLFMAFFCTLYALPEEFHEITRMNSLKPWVPIYEDEDNTGNQTEEPTPTNSV